MKIRIAFGLSLVAMAIATLGAASALAQSNANTGKLKIHVNPKQAYVFVDGNGIRDGSQTIQLERGQAQCRRLQLRIHPRNANGRYHRRGKTLA